MVRCRPWIRLHFSIVSVSLTSALTVRGETGGKRVKHPRDAENALEKAARRPLDEDGQDVEPQSTNEDRDQGEWRRPIREVL